MWKIIFCPPLLFSASKQQRHLSWISLIYLYKIKRLSQKFLLVIIRFKFRDVPCDFSALESAHGIKILKKYYLRRQTRWLEKIRIFQKIWLISEFSPRWRTLMLELRNFQPWIIQIYTEVTQMLTVTDEQTAMNQLWLSNLNH